MHWRLPGLALIALACAACGDSHEKVMEDQLDLMEEMVAALEGITDQASADRATAQIKDLEPRRKELEARMAKLGTPTEEQQNAFKEKHGERLQKIFQRFMALMMKSQQYPELQKVLGDMNEFK